MACAFGIYGMYRMYPYIERYLTARTSSSDERVMQLTSDLQVS